jgi:hypothetical protein
MDHLSSEEITECFKCFTEVQIEKCGFCTDVSEDNFCVQLEHILETFLQKQILQMDAILVDYHETQDSRELISELQNFMISACMHNTHQRSRQDTRYPDIVFRYKCVNSLLRAYNPDIVAFPCFEELDIDEKMKKQYLNNVAERMASISNTMKIMTFEEEHTDIIMTTFRTLFKL